ncbi:hypothetical protein ACS0TY_001564 [Phlomoides rotata]
MVFPHRIAESMKSESVCYEFDGSLREDRHDGEGDVVHKRKKKKKKEDEGLGGKGSDMQFSVCDTQIDTRPVIVEKKRVRKKGRMDENQEIVMIDESGCSQFGEGKKKKRRNNIKEDLSYGIEPTLDGDKKGETNKENAVVSPFFKDENRYSLFDENENVGVGPGDRDEGPRSKQKNRRRKTVESNRKEELSYGINLLSDGNGKKRERKKKKGKQECIVSPYFMNKCTENALSQSEKNVGIGSTSVTADADKSHKRKKKTRKEDVDNNRVEDCRSASRLSSNCEGKKTGRMKERVVSPYFMKKCIKDDKRISQFDEDTGIESAIGLKEKDKKDSKKRKNKRRLNGDGEEENLSKEVHFSNGNLKEDEEKPNDLISTNHDSVKKVSLDDLFSRFMYTDGKSHGIQPSLNGNKGERSEMAKVRVVSPYFANADAQAKVRQVESNKLDARIEEEEEEENENKVLLGDQRTSKVSNEVKTQKSKRRSEIAKVRVVSPYFANADAQVMERQGEPNKLDARIEEEEENGNKVLLGDQSNSKVSRKVKTQKVKRKSEIAKVRVVSPYFANADAQVKEREGEPNKLDARIEEEEENGNKVLLGDQSNSKVSKEVKTQKSKRRSKALNPTLTFAQKRDEAYLRKTPCNTWIPPRSPFNLLQEDHWFDPWRVLVICMLLNQTTGRQAERVLANLFQLCPNAKAATEVQTEKIEEIIRSLGLYKKRAVGIQRLSQEYLDDSWTHVTDLTGVGKNDKLGNSGMPRMLMQYSVLEIGHTYDQLIICS